MATQRVSNVFHVTIDGRDIDDTLAAALVEAIVEDELNVPDQFELVFRDPFRNVLGDAGIKIGSKIAISVVSEVAPEGQPLIEGEVTALEAHVEPDRTLTIIRGYDSSHRLQRGTNTETHLDVTYGDVAGKVAQRRGLAKGDSGSSRTIHEAVIQWNQTDWEFLSGLARAVGHEVLVADGKLHFRDPIDASTGPQAGEIEIDDPRQLVAGKNLIRLRAVVTSGEQVSEVHVKSWDVKTKEAIEGVAKQKNRAASAAAGADPAALADTFDGGVLVLTDLAADSPELADAEAASLAEQIASAAAELDGVALGNPSLRAGVTVSVSNLGQPFDGQYTVTSCRHAYDGVEGYRTEFRVCGRQQRSLLGLTGGARRRAGQQVGGVVPAVVSNIDDPDSLGRVKLAFPWLGDKAESHWARVMAPGAGPERGIVCLPEVGDEVLVAFAEGDARLPFVLGGLFNGKDSTPVPISDLISGGEVKQRVAVSRTGHTLLFDDGKDLVRLEATGGKYQLLLDQANTTIKIGSDGKVEIQASQDVVIKAGAGMSVEATSSLELKGNGITLDAGAGNFQAKGVQATVEGSASAQLTSSGQAKIQGSIVQIN